MRKALAIVLIIAAGLPLQVARASEIQCEGSPPRQTIDPLSPACVTGPETNPGATYKGVTGKQITAILYNDLDVDGDLTAAYDEALDEAPGHQVSGVIGHGQDTNLVLTFKKQLERFQQRFATYGRKVRLIAVSSLGGIFSSCASRENDAQLILRDYDPFVVVPFGDGMTCAVDKFAEEGVTSLGLIRDVPRSTYKQNAGWIWSASSDQENATEASAAFICSKLAGRDARLSTDPTLQTATRKFGLLYPRSSPRGPESLQAASLLVGELESRCGMTPAADGSTSFVIRAFEQSKPDAAAHMLHFKTVGVTTVICYCVPVQTETDVAGFQAAAKALAFEPEWYWDTTSRMYRSVWNRRYSLPTSSFGMSPEVLGPAIQQRLPYLSFRDVVTDQEPNVRFNEDIYQSYQLLFTAIQLAGPTLNPWNLRAGLRTMSLRTGDPTMPDGGFEATKSNRNAFQDTYRAWWFDRTSQEPGMQTRTGCVWMTREVGGTFSAWPSGDDRLFNQAHGSCNGSPIGVGVGSDLL